MKKATAASTASAQDENLTPSQRIDRQIRELTDWRGPALARLRALVHEADPKLAEEWKWDTGVFTNNGMVCAINAFKSHVKINFFKGAALEDKHGLFNAGLDSKTMRSIDFHQDDNIDAKAADLKALIQQAAAHNADGANAGGAAKTKKK